MTIWASGRMFWGWWAVAAGALACVETLPRRAVRLPVLAWVLGGLAARQLFIVLPTTTWSDWTTAWGTVAAFSSVCCWTIAIAFGTQAVIRYGCSESRWMPRLLSLMLTLNLVAYAAQRCGWWSLWKFADHPAGLFPNQVVWAAWCALSLPLVWPSRWQRVAPLVGLGLCYSVSAWVALFSVWSLWQIRQGRHRRVWWVIPVLLGVAWLKKGAILGVCLAQRLVTWSAVGWACLRHPLGIGFSPMSFSQAVGIMPRHLVLPHAASDTLTLLLQAGWMAVPLIGWVLWSLWRLPHSAMLQSLQIAFVLACLQTSVSVPQVGMLVWALLCQFLMDMHDQRSPVHAT